MAAVVTDIPGYRDGIGFLGMAVPFHQIPFIMAEQAQVSLCPAERTWCMRSRRRPDGILIPLLVRSFDIFELA